MEVVNKETEDEIMEDMATTSSSTTPTRTSARLVVKLKKLMQTDMTTPPTEVTMEIDAEEQKKRARATTPLAGMTMASATKDKCNKNPETKKIRNDRTPPRNQPTQDSQKPLEEIEMEVEETVKEDIKTASEESMQEKEKPLEQDTMTPNQDERDKVNQSTASNNINQNNTTTEVD